jgi:transcriptional regulator with XRE-family HTH domain
MDLKKHIGLKVKAARQEQGLTQEQLAAAIEKATETVSNIERGSALTGLDTLQRISRVVGKPMVFFLQELRTSGRSVSGGWRPRNSCSVSAGRWATTI